MSLSLWLLAAVLLFPAMYCFYPRGSSRATTKDEKQLPSPKGYPIIGNVLDIPHEHSWIKFAEWAEELGPIYRLNILGQTHVVISDDEIAHELLRERGLRYSDRPWFHFASGLLTCNLHLLLLSYNSMLHTSFTLCFLSNDSAQTVSAVTADSSTW